MNKFFYTLLFGFFAVAIIAISTHIIAAPTAPDFGKIARYTQIGSPAWASTQKIAVSSSSVTHASNVAASTIVRINCTLPVHYNFGGDANTEDPVMNIYQNNDLFIPSAGKFYFIRATDSDSVCTVTPLTNG